MRYVPDNSYYRNRTSSRTKPAEAGAAVRQHELPFRFLTEFVREPLKMGAFWPSSQALAQVVADACDIRHGTLVVELGPGTGAFTGLLLKRVHGRGRLLAVEISPTQATLLQQRFPRCEVVQDSAEHLPHILGGHRAGCVVSGLAWANMLPRTQDKILDAILESLTPAGQFVAFAYAHAAWMPTSRRFRRELMRRFKWVETTPIVWRNLPPAYVFRCWRGG